MKSSKFDLVLTSTHQITQASRCDVIIVPYLQDKGLGKLAQTLDARFEHRIREGLKLEKFDAATDKSLWLSPWDNGSPAFLVVSVGKAKDIERHALREQMHSAGKTCTSKKRVKVGVLASGVSQFDDNLDAAIEGVLLSTYRYAAVRKKKDTQPRMKSLTVLAQDAKQSKHVQNMLKELEIAAAATFFARDLANGPANVIHPTSMVKEAQRVAREGRLKIKVFDMPQLQRMGMNLIVAVGMGSSEKPRMVHLEYRPSGRVKKTVALVGKGVTFDSGGLSLKTPSTYMFGMKGDMAGSAAVLATAWAIAQLKLPVHVHCVFPLVENMPSDRSVKPGDVFVGYNGKSVEIENTDAEGRLVLADALAYTEQHLKPDVIIDLATLTGACVVALGEEIAGMMGTDEALMDQLMKASSVTGEKLWKLPLEKKYASGLKSDVADMKNVAGRYAGSIVGGLFLSEFVEKTPWVHLDIAGPAFADSPNAMGVKGGTGFPVRTLLNYLKSASV